MDNTDFRPCASCGRPVPRHLHRCRSRACPDYSPHWARDQRRKSFAALRYYGEREVSTGAGVERQVALLTVTAPGADRLPWDESVCAPLGPHRHSGKLGCRVRREAASKFNEQAPRQWTRLHRSVYSWCRRNGYRPRLLMRVVELQHRGVLHIHPVLANSTASERAGRQAYQRRLARVAGNYGFGFVDRKSELRSPTAAAAYLSAYFVTGKRGKLNLQESVTSGEMPRSIIHIDFRLTKATGITMRSLRLQRFIWVLMNRPVDDLVRELAASSIDNLHTYLHLRGPPSPALVA